MKLQVFVVLNWVQVALCGMKYVNLNSKTLKYWAFIFCVTKNFEQDNIFYKYTVKIEGILKIWPMRQMTLKGRIAVFKSLAVSNVINLLLIVKVLNYTIDILYNIQKNFIWQGEK